MLSVVVIFVVGLAAGAAFAVAWGAWADLRAGSLASRACPDCGGEMVFIGYLGEGGDMGAVTFWYCPACDAAADGLVPASISAFASVGEQASILIVD